jgi:hypothetical protein
MRRRALLAAGAAAAGAIAAAGWTLWGKPRPRPRTDPRFLTFGELAEVLARDPKVFEAVLETIGAGRTAVGLVPDAERQVVRQLFARADYAALDRHPRVSVDLLRSAVAAFGERVGPPKPPPPLSPSKREPLGMPTGAPPPTGEPYLSQLSFGLVHGDRIDREKAARFRDSERLAALLERLALNAQGAPPNEVDLGASVAASPEALVRALMASGHTCVVRDERFAANFGDLEKDGVPVATPLWVETGVVVAGDALVVPVPHIQVTLEVRGPRVNADASLYNSLDLDGSGDGGTRFRADVTLDQPWVGGLVYRRYAGAEAVEAVRIMGLLRRFADDKLRRTPLPIDGYFVLGVCTLAPAVVERALTGTTTIWPLTQDPALFDGEGEIEKLVRALPSDGRGQLPELARVLASLPWATRDEVPFPALRQVLAAAGYRGRS